MKKIEKFMFVIPNSSWFGKRYWRWFTPAVTMLAPILERKGLNVKVLEANIDDLTPEQTRKLIEEFKPDVVGISNMSIEYWRHPHFIANIVKNIDKNIITIMGGVHATSLPYKVMEDENIDYIILGEGEERLPKLLDIIESDNPDFSELDGVGYRENKKIIIKLPVKLIENLDLLPLPDYRLFNWKKVFNNEQKTVSGMGLRKKPGALVMTSRGCPNKCCFCAGPTVMGRRIRLRSPENVLKEIDMLVKDYGIKEIIFADDEMYINKERAIKIINGLKKYNLSWKNTNQAAWKLDYETLKLMKETGCYQVIISPESGSERVLREIIHKPGDKEQVKRVVKWCRELGLEVETDFVIGFPGETWDEIRETTNFAEELDSDTVKFAIATPFPGTELYQVALEKGYLPKNFDFYTDEWFGFAQGFIETPEFSVRELQMLRAFEWDRINCKTKEKRERYARMNFMTLEELEEFRRGTRKNVGLFLMQDKDKIKTSKMREINLLESFPKIKREFPKAWRTEENKKIAKLYGKEFFDGERVNGYGGYYYDGRWKGVVKKLQEIYKIDSQSSFLDIGCGKGFLLYDLQDMIPGIKIAGLDISSYALNKAMDRYGDYVVKNGLGSENPQKIEEEARKKILPNLILGSADNLPYPDNSFDFVLSIDTIHNLPKEKCKKAIQEMIRVCRNKKNMFIKVDAYRTPEEKERMKEWVLTAETMMSVDEWLDFFKEAGYEGDYYWTIV